ncbi:MAG TPA: sigma-70 family RNA polymerase sigma factor [Blastocatellia bacterium]|nr:sigma-70 family RNA polymerase sigma factor [Blastocatellia bacterium]
MAAATPSPAANLGQVIEDLLPEILVAVRASLYRCSHRGDRDEIDDLCQEITILLMDDDFRRLRSFDHASSHKTWLTAVVRNHVINHLQRQKTMISLSDLTPATIRCPALQDRHLFAKELRDNVQEALTRLTPREARLFELCYLLGLSTVEIAEGMGIKPQSVRRRKHAVTKKLRQLLQH